MMEIRPIDANALIEWIMPYLHTGDTVEVDTILEDIRAQPTLSLQWISVEDRLPEDKVDGETVLAAVSGKPRENIELIGALMTAGYFTGEGWVINEYPEWENPTVTHWMPLPQPPKEETP